MMISKQWRYSGKLIPASLKRVENYPSHLENTLTYTDVYKQSKKSSEEARKLKKLIEQTERLMEKK